MRCELCSAEVRHIWAVTIYMLDDRDDFIERTVCEGCYPSFSELLIDQHENGESGPAMAVLIDSESA